MRFCKLLLPLLFLTSLGIWAYVLDPLALDAMLPCPWFAATGTQCPGCGLQRATYYVLHLDFRAALHANALAFLLLPLTLAAFASWYLMRCHGVPKERFSIPSWLMWLLTIVVLAWWILRNLK